jgi:thiamine pyrophosphate-dependent acetolactate synthase large subunit-like protein
MPYMRTADAVIESLIRHGIDTLFALPGVHNDHLFDAAHRAQDRFRVLHPRHEQTAAYMALGAALVTGRPQAFAVVPGPGVLNASAALLTAYGMGAPVIALAGQIPSFAIDRGHGHLHEIHDQIGLLRHITKHAVRIGAPHEAPALVAEAVRIACSGRPRPVALECAIDVWGMSGEVASVVVVVFDDGAFGNVRRIQEWQFGNRLIACDLTNPDFVRFAESFGMAAFRATTPEALEAALRQAFALDAPALVHVPVGPLPSPWDMILLPRVRGFADAWRPALP